MEGLGDLADPLDAADELVARAQETWWVAPCADAGRRACDELVLPVDHWCGQRNVGARTGQAGLKLGEDERRLRWREIGLGCVLGVVERDREDLTRLRHRRPELRRIKFAGALERTSLRP